MTRSRRGLGLVTAGACLVVGVGLTGCGSSRDQAVGAPGNGHRVTGTSAATAAGTPTGTASKSGGATAAPVPSTSKLPKLPKGVSTARPKDPVMSSKVAPVKRHGKPAHPSVKTKNNGRSFTKPIAYTDGLTLKITKMTQHKMTGQGPGAFPNRPVTDFHVTLTNGTKKSLDLGVVVVTVTYGSPAQVAHLVYDEKSKDLSGSIKPGGSTRAVYGFSVPAADRAHVTMTVDLDGVHQLAVFTGKVS